MYSSTTKKRSVWLWSPVKFVFSVLTGRRRAAQTSPWIVKPALRSMAPLHPKWEMRSRIVGPVVIEARLMPTVDNPTAMGRRRVNYCWTITVQGTNSIPEVRPWWEYRLQIIPNLMSLQWQKIITKHYHIHYKYILCTLPRDMPPDKCPNYNRIYFKAYSGDQNTSYVRGPCFSLVPFPAICVLVYLYGSNFLS